MAHESIQSKGKGMEIVSGTPSAAQYNALAVRITALETLIGASASAGLRKSIADLETAVGDADSGLVKNVSDLATVVGNSDAGLVKRVSDLELAAQTAAGGSAGGES